MKAFVLAAGLLSTTAGAEAQRGWLTYVGLGVAGPGIVALSLGVADAVQGESARHTLAAYYAHGAAPTVDEAPAIVWLRERAEQKTTSATWLIASGGTAALLGIATVILDGLWAGPSVAFSLRPGGATVLVSASF